MGSFCLKGSINLIRISNLTDHTLGITFSFNLEYYKAYTFNLTNGSINI